MVYVVVMLTTVSILLFADLISEYAYKEKMAKNIIQFIAWMPVVVIAMFRYNVGTDYRLYTLYFNTVRAGRKSVLGSSVEMDMGIFYFNKILQLFTDNPQSFFIVTSVAIYAVVLIYVKRTNKLISLPMLLFFLSGLFFTSLNVIRQFMAFSIVLLFWRELVNKRYWLYIVGCILACAFHLSVIIFVLLVLFRDFELSRGRFLRCILYVGAFMPVISFVAKLIINNTRYSYYLSSGLYRLDFDITGIIYALLINIIVMLVYDKVVIKENGYIYCWMLFFWDATVICSIFIPLTNRLSLYFKLFAFLNVLPDALMSIDNKKIRLIVSIGLILFFSFTSVYLYFVRGLSNVNPYLAIWSKR